MKSLIKKNKEDIQKRGGFTLVEMIVSITIFAIIIIMAFDAMGNIGVLRTKVSSRLDLNNELYNATEKFIDIIKTGGDIDYEEYWNRRAVGTSTSSGHYDTFTGYGNYGSGSGYGDGLYYCISGDGIQMGSDGCLMGFNTYGSGISLEGVRQRYGQYRQQFIDYNSNANNDSGDEDGFNGIQGDDDDEDIGIGPSAFSGGVGTKELYLIKKGVRPERNYLRWTIKLDPNAPSGSTCDISGPNMGSGSCLGNIQILKLIGKDLGLSHSGILTSSGKYDGGIDTWECHPDYNCNGADGLPTGSNDEWISIFPDWVNVKNIDFYLSPEKDFRYSWKEVNDSLVLNSYVRINLTLGLAWEKRRQIKGPPGDITVTTTINLSK